MTVSSAAIEGIETSMRVIDRKPMVSTMSWTSARIAPRPNCSWKRNQM